MKERILKLDNSLFKIFAIPLIFHYHDFRRIYKFLNNSQWWSYEEIHSYQMRRFRRLLNYAYFNVPYYKKILDSNQIKIEKIKDIEDIRKIPFLTKEIVRENTNALKSRNYSPTQFEFMTSGGSTGTPLGFYVQKNVWLSINLAYLKIILDEVDCNLIDKFVYLRDYVFPVENKQKYWKFFIFGRCLVLSSYHITKDTLANYLIKIRKFKPNYMVAYPSVITILARYIDQNNIELSHDIKAILCSSEKLYNWQVELIEKTFNCRVIDNYGCAERVVLSCTCKMSNYHHIFPQYGLTEIIDKNGNPINRDGEVGEIVSTGFHNDIFPFIRYKTKDFGKYSSKKCKCGRRYQLLEEIEGRLQDFIVTKRKGLIPATGMYGLVAKSSKNVKDCQLYQDEEGKIVLNIVKEEGFTDKDKKIITKNFNMRFREDVDFEISIIDEILRDNQGRKRFLLQKMAIENYY